MADVLGGFEQAVLGMAVGESKTATIPSEQAYGPHRTERVINVERHHLPTDLQPELGQQLNMTRPDGTTITVVVTTLTETQVTLDANGAISTALPCRISVYGSVKEYTLATMRPTEMMKAFANPAIEPATYSEKIESLSKETL